MTATHNKAELGDQRQRKINTVFVTGATGYIGGSVAEKLRDSGYKVLGLVRTQEKAELLKKRGIEPILGALEDVKVLQDATERADAVINAADSDNPHAIDIMLKAMERTEKTFIHTSGSSVICDDSRGDIVGTKFFTDDTFFVPVEERVARAAIDRSVREAGLTRGIRTIVLCPTMIYGTGRGIHTESVQVPALMQLSKEKGAGLYVGKGVNRWSNVHIDDMVDLYLLALEKAPSASFYFVENGENNLKEVAEMLSRALGFGGKTESWNADEAFKAYPWMRSGLASNSRVRSTNAVIGLGWSPKGPSIAESIEKKI